MGNSEFHWEQLGLDRYKDTYTYRAKVPGGWLIRTESWTASWDTHGDRQDAIATSTMVFVPDQDHSWDNPSTPEPK